MFLTRKAILKIVMVASLYCLSGGICIGCGILLSTVDLDGTLLFVLGAVVFLSCPLLVLFGRYAEGKGEFINLGNNLVRNELKPAEFLKRYDDLKSSAKLVVNKPSVEILQQVTVAYLALNDKENALAAADEMIAIADKKKEAFAKLIKVSILFSCDRTEEAEALFIEAQSSKPNFICLALIDDILKSDRAAAMGDYKTAELHNLKKLTQKFPKPDTLGRLVIHFSLGEIYEKMQEYEKAASYYRYCADHGGETAFKEMAKSALARLQ